MSTELSDDQLPDDEIARRMERGLRRALNTPPQPHGKNPKTPKESGPSRGRPRRPTRRESE